MVLDRNLPSATCRLNAGVIRRIGLALLLAVAGPSATGEEPASKPPAQPEVLIRPGVRSDLEALGFGWSRQERAGDGSRFAWIQSLEADLYVDRAGVHTNAVLEMRAKPLWLPYRRQVIALYVNHRFVTDWVCPDSPDFAIFETRIPARFFQDGRNTLTLRMAYRKSGGDRRRLSLGVEYIRLRFE